MLDSTKSHLEAFAKKGLRTLCFSMKILEEESLRDWEFDYKILQEKALNNKSFEGELNSKINELESDMLLLGVSGLEDKLQEDVTTVLKDLIEAGINVWMLTGDKLDTAESIGFSCNLYIDVTVVFKVKSGKTNEETLNAVKDILEKMNVIENELVDFKFKRKKEKTVKHKRINKAETLFLNSNKNKEEKESLEIRHKIFEND
jgi:magnesium-transporting ATPase (P-type)